MSQRRTRAEMQEHNRARILAAARDEFAHRGFRDAKIDEIAERAGLTRGAVYSNFPGKRALYFAVLADLAERASVPSQGAGQTAPEALGAFARAWVGRLPLSTEGPRIDTDLIPEILAEERTRQAFAQLMKLNAILLGLALERLDRGDRLVRVAEAALTTLHGATQMAAAAPGFSDPFDIVAVCERLALAVLDTDGGWPPAHLPWAPQARPVDEPWSPPPAVDVVRGETAPLTGDGVVAVLGLQRLEAVEEAVRAAPAGTWVTAVMVTADPGELGPLARLVIADVCTCLRQAFPTAAWPRLRLIIDEPGTVAAAAGVPSVSDATEVSVRLRDARIIARAEGRGACHATAKPHS
ncbi:TetR/AcrR family transcriptional regulator [Actinomadura sp. 7K507]|uniref:TetR/AcrR family transcriptional regulator n=1 Tax=Actinomadura sp. 7K507 TaxID=2530365 RepID=UPI00105371E6|nr:TetR/AcrR family transcriptional regulator [Actinomadura sp. 7K507]TDC83030.1 TetR/AcrR family transcriptional regulator [Actinomadura sp. 7K507]